MSRAAEELKTLLLRTGQRVAVAESLTAGNLQALIASVSGSSDYFEGGVTAYNLEQKVQLLQVDRRHANDVNCVSERVAREMAAGVRQMFRAEISAATTGYAEPSPADDIQHAFAYFAIDIAGHGETGKIEGPGLSRAEMQQHVAESVLRKLVEAVRG